ncbi:hypothetical protein ETH_00040130 [Eimeria tenella]|uniref:Glycogen debranching enzyme glucanotransferase domain-containing protein n=1 Tax=Eimeria tenella TaxID=5802 RepID=U6L514_EIMTE|nr:hypothetical protein ETH_00040130 [Eimeria tenella]CDJ44303.1 hypothetical protein ETH_00040130 [Eimeria tenella]|eukprot:XP_013235052.1 hypothetical protein ETH_00040130 [Eimeria tenella]
MAYAEYNLENSPHLRAAYELDVALQEFSECLYSGGLRVLGCTDTIASEEDLRRVLHALEERVLKPFSFQEWFRLEPEPLIEAWQRDICAAGQQQQQQQQQQPHNITTAQQRRDILYQMVRETRV